MNDATEKTLLPCPQIGSSEWNDLAERSEWAVVASVLRDCYEQLPTFSSIGAVLKVAEDRAKIGWRGYGPAASPPAPAVEPVAYRWRYRYTDGRNGSWSYSEAAPKTPIGPDDFPELASREIAPLYTHPLDAEIRVLLSEALDLCVRARDMDSRDRRQAALDASSDPAAWQEGGQFDRYVARNNIEHPLHQIHTKSATVPLWLEQQYQIDLASWEARARAALMKAEFVPLAATRAALPQEDGGC